VHVSPAYWGYFVAAIVATGVAWLLGGRHRQWLANLLLFILTLFVATFLYVAFSSHKLGKQNGVVAADQAEMNLRVISMSQALQKQTESWFEKNGAGKDVHKLLGKSDTDTKTEEGIFHTAENSLWTAVAQNPDVALYKIKLAILLARRESKEHRSEVEDLLKQVRQTPGTDESAITARTVGDVLERIYVKNSENNQQAQKDAAALTAVLPQGWYRDQALIDLYRVGKVADRLQAEETRIQQRYLKSVLKLALVAVVLLAAALIGVVNLFVQLALTARRPATFADPVGLSIPLKTVYAVFITWFSLQVLMSLGFHYLSGKVAWLSEQPLGIAAGTALTYLLSNIPGPLLIYYLALRPQGLNFWHALQIRPRTSTAGTGKLMASGFLGWCTAIPIVTATAILASKFLGTQGSDNPVLGQIMQAATASSVPATIVFYFTLGVMAPFFEELLFRGFIYASLKPRIGAVGATFSSAALFAIMHFDTGGLFMLFAIGLILAYVFERTRSLLPSMMTHGLWNSGTFTFALIIFSS
jgi:hypothetical protein